MIKKIIFYFLVVLANIFSICSQELPPIKNFSPQDYGSENQNWAIAQGENKFIYVANNKGLLEFNGAEWQLYNSPNETIFRSVKVFNEKIFTGFFMDFGFWERDVFGMLQYTSIVEKTNAQMLEDEQIWNIVEVDGWIVFQSLERIYLYNLSTDILKTINAKNKITRLSKVDGLLYFQDINNGIFKIENGESKLVSSTLILKENSIIAVFKRDNKLLFLTEQNGFYFLNNGAVEKWNIAFDSELQKTKLYSAIQLENGNYVLGTVSNGIINLNENGSLAYNLSQETGLSNDTVLEVFEDKDNNIWLGLDNGISLINNTSSFKTYKKKQNNLGTVYASIIYDENLYLGTNQGLFYKELKSNEDFNLVENTKGQVWDLEIIDSKLFCGHDSGSFIIKNNKANKILETKGVWSIKKYNENTIIQGTYEGLCVLKKVNNNWIFSNKIKGFNNSSRYFAFANANTVFVNHEYKGVYKIIINDDLQSIKTAKKEESIQKGIHSGLLKYKSDILFSSKSGVFKYNSNKDLFQKDTIFSKLISPKDFSTGKLIYNAETDKLWSFSSKNLKYLTSGRLSNLPVIKTIPILEYHRKGASGFENIIEIADDKYLIGTANGFVTVDLKKLKEVDDFKVSINKIKTFQLEKPKNNVSLNEEIILKNKENNIEFFYSVPKFNNIVATNYQYKLEGFNEDWNNPTHTNSVLFDNIPFGDYIFLVKATIAGKPSENIARFKFTIEKPWYLSLSMIIGYIIMLGIFIIIYHVVSKNYYKKQEQILLEKAEKQAKLKELESSKEIIKLNNDKLKSDIKSKNKELASATMNLIKKNDFLNTIKKELKNGDEKSIKKVIKIIDKDLNNTDDWKMFQEAFNNADKKFLKKVKAKHSNLTPNDLRLCAYLRLNLSSKEIAPLLNISPRSVEVKRYRLRKKLDLDHNANLTNYILEI